MYFVEVLNGENGANIFSARLPAFALEGVMAEAKMIVFSHISQIEEGSVILKVTKRPS